MTIPQDLADRLERRFENRDGAKNLDHLWIKADEAAAILAALRSSASAREVETISISKELTPELRDILGMMNFMCSRIAWGFRDAGADIPHKTEAEQAFVLHWLLRKYQDHGADWRKAASDEMAAMAQKLKAAPPASPTTLAEEGKTL